MKQTLKRAREAETELLGKQAPPVSKYDAR